MDVNNRQRLKASAAEALEAAPRNQKLVLIWAGASTCLSFLVFAVQFLLGTQIQDTGGLSGIGLRSILTTVQSLLGMLPMLLIPFWDLGYKAAVLGFSRKKPVAPPVLLEGFRRFGPGFRLLLLRVVLYTGLAFISIYVGSMILSMTPLGMPYYSFILENQEVLMGGVIDETMELAMIEAMTPLLIGCMVLYALVLIPVSYRLRLAEYCLMDIPNIGALMSLRQSNRTMRGKCKALFRLDLSFWWFYLAQTAITVFYYGDMLLPALGVSLPISAEAASFAFYIVGLLAQLALLYFFGNRVETTYARFYHVLMLPEEREA